MVRPAVQETTALGAAYAAGLAVGYFADTQTQIEDLERGVQRVGGRHIFGGEELRAIGTIDDPREQIARREITKRHERRAHRDARAGLHLQPRLAAELRELWLLAVGADVARQLRDLLVRQVEPVLAAEGEVEVVARDAGDLLRLEAEQLADTVVLVDDVVAGAEVGEALEGPADAGVGARAPQIVGASLAGRRARGAPTTSSSVMPWMS